MSLKRIEELPIFDAKRPINLHITAKDVSTADPKRPNSCAVAKACKRSLHALEVRVHLSRVYIRSNKMNWQRYLTPNSLRQEIIAFDRGGQFEPGVYKLGRLQPSKRVTGKAQGSRTSTQTKKKPNQGKKRAYHVVKNVRTGPA